MLSGVAGVAGLGALKGGFATPRNHQGVPKSVKNSHFFDFGGHLPPPPSVAPTESCEFSGPCSWFAFSRYRFQFGLSSCSKAPMQAICTCDIPVVHWDCRLILECKGSSWFIKLHRITKSDSAGCNSSAQTYVDIAARWAIPKVSFIRSQEHEVVGTASRSTVQDGQRPELGLQGYLSHSTCCLPDALVQTVSVYLQAISHKFSYMAAHRLSLWLRNRIGDNSTAEPRPLEWTLSWTPSWDVSWEL